MLKLYVITLILLGTIISPAQDIDKRYFTDQFNYVPDELIQSPDIQ